jgi:diguanylate cyclase (GGDEF)-like protein
VTKHAGMAETAERELEKVLRELEFRTTITTAMLGTLDLEQILYVILSGITSGDGLGFNRAFLFLTDEAGRTLRVTMALGPPSQEAAHRIWDGIRRKRLTLTELLERYETYRSEMGALLPTQRLASFSLPIERLEAVALSPQALIVEKRAPLAGVLGRCLVNRSPFASNGLILVVEVGGAKGAELSFRNLAIVPLTVADRLIGAILADNFYNQQLVGSEDLRALHAFGNLAALAIERARLHARTAAMAEVDGLTGVYNRRYYHQELERLLRTVRRSGQVASIVVFDLDNFKRYNDEHGHLVGDEVLKDVARLLSDNVRGSDTVARYGGEEFVVLLAETGPEAAAQVAEKLRLLVKEESLAGGVVEGLTLSAGVAGTDGSETVEQLFQRADRALYQAKHDGRDRVVVWTSELGSNGPLNNKP